MLHPVKNNSFSHLPASYKILFVLSTALLLLGHNEIATTFLSKTPYIIPALLFRALAFFLSILMLFSFYGIGVIASPFLKLSSLNSGIKHIIRFFSGYACAGALVYLLGILHILHPLVFLAVLIAGLFVAVFSLPQPESFPQLPAWSSLSRLMKWGWGVIAFCGVSRLFVVLNFNAFGDPLFYTLPSGRDYLRLGGFEWIEHAELYFQAGFSDLLLIYLHSITSNALLVQLTAQSFYYLMGPVLFFCILHFEWFSLHIPKQHSLWLAFSFAGMGMFRLEAIIAKPDYLLIVLLCLILALIHRLWNSPSENQKIALWKSILLLAALCVTIKNTSIFFILPLAFGILLMFKRKLPVFGKRYRGFLPIACLLAMLNILKSWYVYKSPVFPFANQWFKSPYWGDTYIMNELGSMKSNGLLQMTGEEFQVLLLKIMTFFTGNYTSLLLLLCAIVWLASGKFRGIQQHKDLDQILVLTGITWLGSIILWINLLPLNVVPRYVIGSAYLSLLIPAVGSMYFFRETSEAMAPNIKKRWEIFAYVSLLLTFTGSHVDVDVNQLKSWASTKSIHQQWVEESSFSELQNYLNQRVSADTLVLFYYTTQRFHANFISYGARWISPRSSFVYTDNKEVLETGLKKIDPKYFVIPKSMLNTSSILSQKTYLAQNFHLEKEFQKYLLYKMTVSDS